MPALLPVYCPGARPHLTVGAAEFLVVQEISIVAGSRVAARCPYTCTVPEESLTVMLHGPLQSGNNRAQMRNHLCTFIDIGLPTRISRA